MAEKATLAAAGVVSDIPPALMGFVNFRAGLEKRELDGSERLVVLRIGDTDCYHVIFLDPKISVNAIEQELGKLEARLDAHAKDEVQKMLKNKQR
jgi:hypothetical protein